MNTYLVPLGTRCNAALLTKEIVDQPRFPFDWTQMNVESMRDVIHLEYEDIRDFWSTYFSSIDDTKHHTQTGSWFPHDSFSEEEKQATIDKYVRRTERFHAALNTPHRVTYVIIFGFPEHECIDKVLELTFAIKARQCGPCSFLVCNAMKQEVEKEDTVFLYEELYTNKGFEEWEDLLQRLVKRVKTYLESHSIQAVPFPWKPLERVGYGSQFNRLATEGNMFIKQAKNAYGRKKLHTEINAYTRFQREVPTFPLPIVHQMNPDSLYLEYYADYKPLWKVYQTMNELQRSTMLRRIQDSLQLLHSKQMSVTRERYLDLLLQETVDKTRIRYHEVKDTLGNYAFTKVNGVPCLSFMDCLAWVEKETQTFVQQKTNYTLSYIHGDPQFNNILWKEETEDILFLDPRGYFGDSMLWGITEYDTAKLLFALSGYDVFDSTSSFDIVIEDNNIILPDFVLDKRFETMNPGIHFLLASIWLANSHCFLDNPVKAVISHAYARLLTTRFLGSKGVVT